MLVLIRTFLSWALVVEIERRWPMAVLERASAGVQRNDPCPCNSERKFKHRHGQIQRQAEFGQFREGIER